MNSEQDSCTPARFAARDHSQIEAANLEIF